MTPIPVMYSFARSGGTLVNQLLGVHPSCLVLSEVNPAASVKPVAEQASEWLGLAAPGEAPSLDAMPYGARMAALHQRARERGKTLVVRDWVTVNFVTGCTRDPIAASGLLEQRLYLERAGLEARPLVVTRRSRAVVRSAQRHFPGMPPERDLAQAYLRYARAVSSFPRVHLEALRAKPEEATAEILRLLGLDPADPAGLVRDFHGFDKCTGNNTLAEPAASSRAANILPPEPEPEPEPRSRGPARDGEAELAEADRIFGYD